MPKNSNAKAASFSTHKNVGEFLASFNSHMNKQRFQCLNCSVWKRGDKFVAVGQYEQMAREIFGFRFCRACWQAYRNVLPELKQDFIKNIRAKIQNTLEVKTDA